MIEIIWDVHGSLVDFARAAAALHRIELPPELPGHCELGWNLGIKPDEFWQPEEFRNPQWWSSLKTIRSLVSSLKVASVIRGVSSIQLVTSPGSPDECRPAEVAGTTQLTLREFGLCPWIIDVKAELCRPGRILVDDNETQVDAWRARGGTAVTPPQPWNAARCWPLKKNVEAFRALLARAIQQEVGH